MKKIALFSLLVTVFTAVSIAQIDINKILDLGDIVGKTMTVKKGFAPKFAIGNLSIPKINQLGEIFGMKQNADINRLFKIYKTGRTVYRVAAYAGGAIALYGTIRAIDKAAAKQDYQGALIGGLTTIGSGLITKFLTKTASYKAVDIFNGVIRKKVKDIFSIQPASSTMGMGLYVNLN